MSTTPMIAAIDAQNSYRRKAETACSSRSPLTSARQRDRDQLGRHRDRDEVPGRNLSNDGFEALSFEADRPFAADRFQYFLELLPNNVFRAKGVLWINESDRRYVFHLVGKRFTLDETGWSSPMSNRLVLIGRNLDRARLREELERCLT
jgi:G3E family GTPase